MIWKNFIVLLSITSSISYFIFGISKRACLLMFILTFIFLIIDFMFDLFIFNDDDNNNKDHYDRGPFYV